MNVARTPLSPTIRPRSDESHVLPAPEAAVLFRCHPRGSLRGLILWGKPAKCRVRWPELSHWHVPAGATEFATSQMATK